MNSEWVKKITTRQARAGNNVRHVKCKYGCLRIRGSYKSVDEYSDLMGYDAVTLGECFRTFRRITAPSSLRSSIPSRRVYL